MQFLWRWTTIHNYMRIKHYNHIPPWGFRKHFFRVFSYIININSLFYGRHSVKITKFYFHNFFMKFPLFITLISEIIFQIKAKFSIFFFSSKQSFLRKSDTWYLNRSYFSVPYVLISFTGELNKWIIVGSKICVCTGWIGKKWELLNFAFLTPCWSSQNVVWEMASLFAHDIFQLNHPVGMNKFDGKKLLHGKNRCCVVW